MNTRGSNRRWFQRVQEECRVGWYQIYDVFVPKECACCLAYGDSLGARSDLCARCSFLLRQSLLNVHRPVLTYPGPPVVSAGLYEYELAGAILAYKNGGRVDLLPYFATALNRALNTLLGEGEDGDGGSDSRLFLVPIPSERSSTWRRGFEPAELLARRALREFSRNLLADSAYGRSGSRPAVLPAVAKKSAGLLPTGSGSGQKTLGQEARLRRAHRSMVLAKPPLSLLGFGYDVRGKTCVLIDDVVTTGASLLAAAQTLEEAGAKVLGACTVASVSARSTIRGFS